MARAIARGVTAGPSNPTLDFWSVIAGVLTDVYALTFQVFDLSTGAAVQSFPVTPGQQQSVNVAGAEHLGTGHYAATWAVGGGENLGLHRILWFVTPTNGAGVVQYQMDFDVLAAGLSLKGPAYCLLSDLRTEGFDATTFPDVRALSMIVSVSKMVERYTRRFFDPRYRTFTINGSAGPTQFFQDPVIALDSARIDGDLVDASSYRVFNRHISDGLTNPDDRDNPRVEFVRLTRVLSRVDSYDRPYVNKAIWWPGPRNVQLIGLFGFTDPDADLPVGTTPDLIKRCTILLFQREAIPIAQGDDRADAQNAGRVNELRTRDQSLVYGPDRSDLIKLGGSGEFTGDPEIDDILAQYTAPPVMVAV